jgi:XTP/dITP diphosphohydrolase
MRIVLATNNLHKVREMQAIAASHSCSAHTVTAGVEFVTPDSLGLAFSAEEDGADFRANALIKAHACFAVSRRAGLPVLADDSGLVVHALGGRPGVFSARYAGGHGDDAANIARVLSELAAPDVAVCAGQAQAADRSAAFVCALAYIDASGGEHFFEGQVRGEIAPEPGGTGGFGYDPVFYLPEKGCTMAELPPEAKNELSHRARALEAFLAWLGAQSHFAET